MGISRITLSLRIHILLVRFVPRFGTEGADPPTKVLSYFQHRKTSLTTQRLDYKRQRYPFEGFDSKARKPRGPVFHITAESDSIAENQRTTIQFVLPTNDPVRRSQIAAALALHGKLFNAKLSIDRIVFIELSPNPTRTLGLLPSQQNLYPPNTVLLEQ
ncbi:hypothetical protein ACEPAH_9078 [Sanghuangporus vaninii]